MSDLTKLTIDQLIDPRGFDCGCGRHHAVKIAYVKSCRGAIEYAPEMLRTLCCRRPFVLCDQNTYRAAGEKLCAVLDAAQINYTLYVLPCAKPAPDEWTIGNALMHFDMNCDLEIGRAHV